MADRLNLASDRLSNSYVYYKESIRLKGWNDETHQFERDIQDALSAMSLEGSFEEAKNNLRRLWAVERAKEVRFLKENFDVDLSYILDNPREEYIYELVTWINNCINYRDAFDAIVKKIAKDSGGAGHVTLATNITDRVNQYWNNCKNDITIDITTRIEKGEDPADVFQVILKEWFYGDSIILQSDPEVSGKDDRAVTVSKLHKYGIVPVSIWKAFNANLKRGDDTIKPYRDLYNILFKMSKDTKTPVGKQIVSTLHIDTFLQDYMDSLLTPVSDELEKKIKDENQESRNEIITSSIKGDLHELLSRTFISSFLDEIKSSPKLEVVSTGASKARPDNIYLVGARVPISSVNNLYDTTFRTREMAIAAALELTRKLRKASKGTIIYESAKNYAMGKSLQKLGFSAGSAVDLESYAKIFSYSRNSTMHSVTHLNILELMQTITGAVLDSSAAAHQEEVRKRIATQIAYFLFDDVSTIGQELVDKNGNSGVNTLHLMNLSDIYIPLSVILELLFKSFEDTQNQNRYQDIAKVQLLGVKSTSILYPTRPEGYTNADEGDGTAMKYWNEQKHHTQKSLSIKIGFFRNFEEFVMSLRKYMKI